MSNVSPRSCSESLASHLIVAHSDDFSNYSDNNSGSNDLTRPYRKKSSFQAPIVRFRRPAVCIYRRNSTDPQQFTRRIGEVLEFVHDRAGVRAYRTSLPLPSSFHSDKQAFVGNGSGGRKHLMYDRTSRRNQCFCSVSCGSTPNDAKRPFVSHGTAKQRTSCDVLRCSFSVFLLVSMEMNGDSGKEDGRRSFEPEPHTLPDQRVRDPEKPTWNE